MRGALSARFGEALFWTRGPKWTRVFAPVDASQIRIRPSWPEVTRWLPSEVQRTPVATPLCARASRENALRAGCVGEDDWDGSTPTASSMSRVAIAELRPPRRISNIMTRLSAEAEARMCSLCGAQTTEGMAASCPGSEWVESPDRRSKSLTDRADVPTAINRVDAGCEENEWE